MSDKSGPGNKRFYKCVGRKDKVNPPSAFLISGQLSCDDDLIAEAFNQSFQRNFSKDFFPRSYNFPPDVPRVTESLTDLHFDIADYLDAINSFRDDLAPGPDNINVKILKNCLGLARPLVDLFNSCLDRGILPHEWRTANVVPVYKKGPRDRVENYRPISLTSVIMRCFEKLIYKPLMTFLSSVGVPGPSQHGFRPKLSCTSNLLVMQHQIFEWLESRECNAVDGIFLDWSKAFDKVNHNSCLSKLEHYGIRGNLLQFFTNFLSNGQQRVSFRGELSSWLSVSSGVPQGTVLAPMLFIIYVHDIAPTLQTSIFSTQTILSCLERSIRPAHARNFLPTLLNCLSGATSMACRSMVISLKLSVSLLSRIRTVHCTFSTTP